MIMMSAPLKRDYKGIRRQKRKERGKNSRKHWEKLRKILGKMLGGIQGKHGT